MAFDVFYGHMDASEQEYLMDAIPHATGGSRAHGDGGRVEALRENNSHIHVRPVIARSAAQVRPPRVAKAQPKRPGGARSRGPAHRTPPGACPGAELPRPVLVL